MHGEGDLMQRLDAIQPCCVTHDVHEWDTCVRVHVRVLVVLMLASAASVVRMRCASVKSYINACCART